MPKIGLVFIFNAYSFFFLRRETCTSAVLHVDFFILLKVFCHFSNMHDFLLPSKPLNWMEIADDRQIKKHEFLNQQK